MKLDMNAETPLYMQLKEAIKAAIKDGTYPDNEKIPTEIELSEYYDVSRITVRRAVEELCQENYLVKRQGKGTFVKSRKIQRKMEHLLGFADACKANGCIPSRLVVKRSVIELSDEDAKTMNVPAGAKAVLIERIDLADGIPMIYESNLFPYPKYEFLLEESLDGSLYQLLKDSYHIPAIRTLNWHVPLVRLPNIYVSPMENLYSIYTPRFLTQTIILFIFAVTISAENNIDFIWTIIQDLNFNNRSLCKYSMPQIKEAVTSRKLVNQLLLLFYL
jgi:GntR family transcriptional regulator